MNKKHIILSILCAGLATGMVSAMENAPDLMTSEQNLRDKEFALITSALSLSNSVRYGPITQTRVKVYGDLCSTFPCRPSSDKGQELKAELDKAGNTLKPHYINLERLSSLRADCSNNLSAHLSEDTKGVHGQEVDAVLMSIVKVHVVTDAARLLEDLVEMWTRKEAKA